ncbi:MAG: protein kinase, partial [Planctomycetes bacterium]|nr:protein kinase [Planctomycetota bacterium]
MPTPSGSPEDETHNLDAVLVEGLRRLHAGDSSGWRRLLREHPDRAVELEGHALRLQRHGFLHDHVVPARVGAFTLLRRIGRGGMGVVYRARGEGLAEECAVKIVRPELLDGDYGRQRFAREVAAVGVLQHPGIVRVIDVGVDDELPWFAMDLVVGRSLAELIAAARAEGGDSVVAERGAHLARMPATGQLRPWPRFVLEVLVQVLDALQHAHQRGVLHRDVKPSNVLVADDGRVRLIDFGLAHVTTATTITRSSDSLGTLPYMAPELLAADGHASIASDLYAVGATMYHALGLQLPFVGASAEGLRNGILRTTPRSLRELDPRLPEHVAIVCATAMSPEPSRRYRDAAAFQADLRAVLEGRRPSARPPGLWLSTRRWVRRRPLLALGLVLGAAFAVVLPTSLYWVQSIELIKTVRLSDLHRVRDLHQRSDELWPARPEVVTRPDGIDAWLVEADELLGRRARHERDLESVRRRGRAMTEAERNDDRVWRRTQGAIDDLRADMLDATSHRAAGWQDWLVELREHEGPLLRRHELVEGVAFSDPADRPLFRNLGELVLGLEVLAADRERLVARRARAERLRVASLDAAAEQWRATLDELADPVLSPVYRGLRIAPQFGLVPLGRDSHSGFFEFAHLASGEVPERGPDGRFHIGERDGIVLVLLPGGMVRIGADLDAAGPHYDPEAVAADTPSVEVCLDPFFLGKFEVTQAQWVRQRGHNNCLIKVGSVAENPAQPITWANPVDTVGHGEAVRIAAEWGLTLPTGAQWEYGARGGTTGRTWCGGGVSSLDGSENLADGMLWKLSTWFSPGDVGHLQPEDGWPAHAPVGTFEPNPFGLFDVLGNSREMTIDAARPYSLGLREGDGCTGNVDAGSIRGG